MLVVEPFGPSETDTTPLSQETRRRWSHSKRSATTWLGWGFLLRNAGIRSIQKGSGLTGPRLNYAMWQLKPSLVKYTRTLAITKHMFADGLFFPWVTRVLTIVKLQDSNESCQFHRFWKDDTLVCISFLAGKVSEKTHARTRRKEMEKVKKDRETKETRAHVEHCWTCSSNVNKDCS